MQDLIILGTGVHAQEMVEIVDRVNQARPTYNLLGMIGTDPTLVGKELNGAPVLGLPGDLVHFPGASLVPSLVEWDGMGKIPLDRLVSLIDPSAVVSRTASIGRGCVIYPHTFIGLNARIDDLVFCLAGCVINHDDHIMTRTILATGVHLAGSVTIEPDCYLGQSCTIRQCLKVGCHSLIGMGAVVVKDVDPDSVMAGNPARWMRKNAAIIQNR